MPVKKGRKAQTAKTSKSAARLPALPKADLSALFLYGHAAG
ncbi:MAG TPA: hypothetical protein VD929_07395 [Caulobacteraceae bacterium]|nr:hypothetical protein [Caulobacteraceae bacterium]